MFLISVVASAAFVLLVFARGDGAASVFVVYGVKKSSHLNPGP